MEWLTNTVWNGLLEIPINFLQSSLGMDLSEPWMVLASKAAVILLLLFIGWFVFTEISTRFRDFRRGRELNQMETSIEGKKQVLGEDFMGAGGRGASLSKAQIEETERTIAMLKKNKDYKSVADKYSGMGRFKEAAKWYKKAGETNKSAMAWAKAGYEIYAAKQFLKHGEFAQAGEFFAQKGKYAQAATAYEQGNDVARAAENFARAGKVEQAVENFKRFFSAAGGNAAQALAAAERCYTVLNEPKVQSKVSKKDMQQLLLLVADRFEKGGKAEFALKLFKENGDPGRAGEILLKAGKLEDAAKCMQQAGRTKDAAEIGGRYYESIGRFKEAAMAYEGAQIWARAGDCFSKVSQADKAAECYEKGGEMFGAGFARTHMKDWPNAIRCLQAVPESHPKFDLARAMLGRAFYLSKDYQHCVATLENYLTGSKVTNDNIDYYWMLALAYEQVGKLSESKDMMLKIRSVNMEYRDISRRLSNIDSRISMGPQAMTGASVGSGAQTQQGGMVMGMVENSLGDRFTLERELGRGGMGVVYKAVDKSLDRPVALKFLGSLVDGNEEYKLRFVREARAAAKVQHPNVVAIYDIGSDEGKAYIAMEYIEGPNLHKYLSNKGRLDVREAINITVQAASALEAVHAAGIIHRDIKPDNILIAKGGLVKLMDFGLAKGDEMKLTATRVVMGTPCYMSPEQAKGEKVDNRADIYALGLVLYECLTGETVFGDGDVLRRQVMEMPPPPSSKVPGLPPEMDTIIMKSIAKNRDERYQSITDMIAHLRAVPK
jgi:tetratricopeptide (TPR) repeat protein/predicted Ser/Thr protein kinase